MFYCTYILFMPVLFSGFNGVLAMKPQAYTIRLTIDITLYSSVQQL